LQAAVGGPPPPVPDTVMAVVPAGVVPDVVSVSVELQGGEQAVGENDAVVPAGRPLAPNEVDVEAPDTSVEVIVFTAAEPRMTDRLPPFVKEKSNGACVVAGAGAD